ncbi:MAG: UvrD-helicase domain-containing protein, partial [Candidatus Sungbacteria bacterium]|nr:UvrD-helicase domain-containing protein [Candidatus Sungbacteria bacterium]
MLNILESLNKEQQTAVQTVDGPVLIIAGAGSGKTKALTHRIAYLVEHNIKPENILALTFTNKAAEEMKKRVNQLISLSADQSKDSQPINHLTDKLTLGFIGTFHSFAAKILRREIHLLGYGPNFTIYDDADSFVAIKEIMAELAIDPDQFKPGGIKSAISKQKNELINAASYNTSSNDFYAQTVSRVFTRYETYLKEADALDFDDLLMLTVELFKKLPEVLEKYQNQFRYILVDEYQDTNRAQYILLKLLAQKYKNLCVVGDDWQSVYAFRGADFRNILTFEKDYPEAKIVFLEENYRSTQNILDAAHAVIQKNVYKTEKKLWTRRDRGEKIKIVQTADEIEEGMFITGEIKKILALGPDTAADLNDFVVLYRTNAQSRAIEEAILREGWNYRLVGAVKFYERREIKDVICYLRFIQNEKDIMGLKRIINTPPRGLGRSAWDKIVLYGLGGNLTQPKIKNFFDL